MKSLIKCAILFSVSLVLASCGGGGGGSSSPAPTPAPPPSGGGPTVVTKSFTVSLSGAEARRPSNDETVTIDVTDISASGTVRVTE